MTSQTGPARTSPTGACAARAPGRVNLVGEHTDYNAGLCLPLAIDHEARARVRVREDDVVRLVSHQQGEEWSGRVADLSPDGLEGWAAYTGGVVWALREAGRTMPGLDVEIDSTVPMGAGLSSSAAVEVAVAVAVTGVLGEDLTDDLREELMAVCMRAESDVAGAPTGGMDQAASLFARAAHALLLDFDDGSRRQVPLAVEDHGLTLLVTDTRASHALGDGGYASRRQQCEEAASALGLPSLRPATREQVEALEDDVQRRRARHVVTENERVRRSVAALEAEDWTTLGACLDASHDSLRDDYEVSCAELDTVVAAARSAGALGSRMVGGGFGGSTVTLVPTDRVPAVREAVDAAFDREGFDAPRHVVATPAAGASRLPEG